MSDEWTPRTDQSMVLAALMLHRRVLCLPPTGAGKTALSSTWALANWEDGIKGPILVVAPKRVVPQWPIEFRKWHHLAPLAAGVREIGFPDLDLRRAAGKGLDYREGKAATKKRLESLLGALPGIPEVHVTSWDAFPWLVRAWGTSLPYEQLILDEVSTLKDRMSERGKAARFAVHKVGRVKAVIGLSASPAENHEPDLFGPVDLIAPGLLGDTLTDFRETYCAPASKNWSTGVVYSWKVRRDMREQWHDRLARVAVSAPESLGLEVVEADRPSPMSEAARGAYDALKKGGVAVVKGRTVRALSEAVLHGKLRQIAGTGAVIASADEAAGSEVLALDDERVQDVVELIQEIGRPVLLAYYWQHEQRRLAQALGRRMMDIRQVGAKDAFLSGRINVLGVQLKSAAHGIDGLQGVCHHMVFAHVPEDLELYRQTVGRLKRPGQQQTVYVHRLYAPGTVEERVLREVLPRKAAVAERVHIATQVQ